MKRRRFIGVIDSSEVPNRSEERARTSIKHSVSPSCATRSSSPTLNRTLLASI